MQSQKMVDELIEEKMIDNGEWTSQQEVQSTKVNDISDVTPIERLEARIRLLQIENEELTERLAMYEGNQFVVPRVQSQPIVDTETSDYQPNVPKGVMPNFLQMGGAQLAQF